MIPLLVAGGMGLLGLIGGGEIRRFERSAASEIASRLSGEGKKVVVTTVLADFTGNLQTATISASNFSIDSLPLFTEPKRSKRGKIGTLNILLTDFTVRGLHVEELSAKIADCRYDVPLAMRERKVRLSKSGTGPGYVRLNERDIEKFILHKYKEIKTVKVELQYGKLSVIGHGDFLFLSTDFEIIADLEPRNGTQLFLTNAKVYLDGRRAFDGADRVLLQAINPVIDENKDLRLYSALLIDRVHIRNGKVELFGTSSVPDLPAEDAIN